MTAPHHPRQMPLPMLTWYSSPAMVDTALVDAMPSYRAAVRKCWALRTRPHMTKRQLAEETGCYPSHITDHLSPDDSRRDLPARHIAAFEAACGNRLVSQWIARRSELTVLEELQTQRRVA
ncbi:MAG: hypothetical protein AB7I35_01415 [Ramlibacter sp.]